MLTLNITDIRNDSLKRTLKQRGLKNSKTSSTEYKKNLDILIEEVNAAPNEPDVKARIRDFLINTEVTSTRNIILEEGHVDISLRSPDGKRVASFIEVKHVRNDEMIKKTDGNRKALHELIWYFLNEIFYEGNIRNYNLESLAVTDGIRWFLFSPKDFYHLFGEGDFAKQYNEFKSANYGNEESKKFYKITKDYLDKADITLPCIHFDLADLKVRDIETIKNVLSQQFLVGGIKEKDSNEINSKFYDELLHIIGLEERTENKKLIIGRKKEDERDEGSLLELAINKLNDKYPFDGTMLYDRLTDYGNDHEEQIFNVALELCLMWVNRILFLKLLETSLLTYKNSNKPFLNISTIPDFQSLYQLFFKVMGTPVKSREMSLRQKFSQVPYLNSSLFELSLFENASLVISNLASDKDLPLFSGSILKNAKKSKVKYHTLEYLFQFLNAYKFGDDEDCTINASVLGKVFEKINGYKDGSVYTPGYITAYMCKDSINAAVLARFSETLRKQIGSIDELRNIIDCSDFNKKDDLVSIFNSVTLCDISVGSGHYLVSALNYFLFLKWDLGLFFDAQKRNLQRFKMELKDDSLKIYRGAEELKYDFNDGEIQSLQEALFEEKKRLLENNLFGVDLNPNSVNICRLRLWIELLKSAYYKAPDYTELQTLPNVDLNIKRGDSLLSKLPVAVYGAIEASGSGISEEDVKEYKKLAKNFKNTDDKVTKGLLNKQISNLKFKIRGEYVRFFEFSEEYKKKNEEMEKNDAYRHSLEWMFEFPELVNSKGQFIGFDIVIGNPPYINLETIDSAYLYGDMIQNKKNLPVYSTFCKGGDIFTLFVERAYALVGNAGVVSYIMPNKWMTTNYGKLLRRFFLEKGIDKLVDFGDAQVFPKVTTYTCIFSKYGKETRNELKIANVSDPKQIGNATYETFTRNDLSEDTWIISSLAENRLMRKLKNELPILRSVVGDDVYYGIKCGCVEAFIVDANKKEELVKEDTSATEILKPLLKGDGQIAWNAPNVDKYLLAIPKGFSKGRYGVHEEAEMWEMFKSDYPSVARWLDFVNDEKTKRKDKKNLKNRSDMGDFWWEIRACSYYEKFSEPRIMYQRFSVTPCFIFNDEDLFCDDSMWMINVSNKSLLTLLNSKMGWWLISKTCPLINGGRQLIWDQFSQIPIPPNLSENLSEIAEQILEARKNGIDTKVLENKADELVYDAYGLTDDERKVIDDFSEKEAAKRASNKN